MKKILIIYATAGIGHKKASMAVKKAFDEASPKDTEVTMIDALDYTNAFFKWSYLQAYLTMVNKLPLFWGFLYYVTDNFYLNLLISKIRRLNNWLNCKKLEKHLMESKYDVIVSTHFLASEVIADMKSKNLLNSKLITVVTDYRLHSWWVAEPTDVYVVGSSLAKKDLIGRAVPENKIKVLGIPAEPLFSKKLDRASLIEKFALRKNVPTILIVGGGFGVGPIESIVKNIAGLKEELQLIVICGRNEELRERIESLERPSNIQMKTTGFVDNVYEFMEVSDILISKSGGITVTEAMNKELPMIIISPIIGQETHNSDFLTGAGAALRVDDLSGLKNIIEDLVAHPEKFAAMKKAIDKIRSPRACYDIAQLALNL